MKSVRLSVLPEEAKLAVAGLPPVLDGASGSLRFRLLLSNFECTLENDTLRFTNARADLLVAETPTPGAASGTKLQFSERSEENDHE